jgi:hypothetical protein
VALRLRQVVLAAGELEPVASELQAALGLGAPFADPGVAEFGLRNAVFALGDCFIEVIAPTSPDAPAARWLERRGGDGGYMLIFQLDDLAAARERAAALGIRVVWSVDLPDISGTHLHPADMRGAIVSLDSAEPPESWRWGGPDWTARAGIGAAGEILGVDVASADPEATSARWAQVLGEPAGAVRFVAGEDAVTAVRVRLPGGLEPRTIGGVRFESS